jgi:hypothetical protein
LHVIFLLENPKGRDHMEELVRDGRIVLKIEDQDVSWIRLAHDKKYCRVLLNIEMNILIS